MTRIKHARLRLPARAVFCGSVISLSMGVGWSWWAALVSELATAAYALGLFVTGRNDTDTGAIVGHRADERQQLVMLRGARLALLVAIVAMLVACVAAGAAKDKAVFYPFDLLTVVTTIAYLVGLRVYGVDRDQDDATGSQNMDGRVTS
jgi:hypothetical protein